MRAFAGILFLLAFCLFGEGAAGENVSVEQCRKNIIAAHDLCFEKPSDQSFRAWYEVASEAYRRYPRDPEIARRFAFVAMSYASAGEALKVLLPLLPEMNSDWNIALGIWQIFDCARRNAVNTDEYRGQLYLYSLTNEEAERVINCQWQFWAGQIINVEELKPVLRKRIAEARNNSADQSISLDEAARTWRIILEKINEHDRMEARNNSANQNFAPVDTAGTWKTILEKINEHDRKTQWK